MTDEQRAGLARDHLEKASHLIDKLAADGADELDGARENMIDVIGLLDDLEFEEGNLVSGEPAMALPATEDEEEEETEEFREDAEEE